jgi:hypothetical protein
VTDNVTADPGALGAVFATDDIAGVHYPITKFTFGALDSQTIASSGTGTDDAGTQRVTLATDISLPTGPVTNAGTFVVQEDGAALTALQLIDDPVFADDDPFTLASSKTMVAGAIRDDSLPTLSAAEGDVVPLRVNSLGELHVHSHLFDPGTVDGFGHLLVNEGINQVEIQFFRDTPANLLTVTTAGGGATSQVGGAGKFETSTAGTANAKGVTALTTSYRSASEIFVLFSTLFTTPTDGNGFQRIGLYDDNNGVFIGFEGTTFGVTIRNATSDTQTAKASFSEDTLTGAVGSRFRRDGSPEAIDLTKFNVFRIRYGWLGSAPIFFEVLSPDGEWITFHTIRQPNNAVVASMEDPDLPMTLHVSKTAADATNLIMLTNCWAAGVTSGALPLDETLTDDNLAKVVRTIIAGKNPGGTYVNFTATTAGNFKTSVQEISDGLDIGAGNAGTETQRVSISTDDVNLSAIKTATELTDDPIVAHAAAISGSTGVNVVGARAVASVEGQTETTAADASQVNATLSGNLITQSQVAPEELVSFHVANTDGAEDAVTGLDAGGATVHNYITSVTISNRHASTDAQVNLLDGSAGSVFWEFPAPATGGTTHNFSPPLKQPTVNTALFVDPSAAVTTIGISIAGYQGQG